MSGYTVNNSGFSRDNIWIQFKDGTKISFIGDPKLSLDNFEAASRLNRLWTIVNDDHDNGIAINPNHVMFVKVTKQPES